jgi:hypothetical protein
MSRLGVKKSIWKNRKMRVYTVEEKIWLSDFWLNNENYSIALRKLI